MAFSAPSFFNANDPASMDELERRKAMAAAMLMRGQTGSANSIGEGLAQLGQALAGRIGVSSADRKINARRSKAYGMLPSIFGPAGVPGGGDSAVPSQAPAGRNGPMGMSFNGAIPEKSSLASGIVATANSLGIPPLDLATSISYETGGTFNPTQAGPTTKWGQHKGFIQFGEPQAKQYGVDWSNPVSSQLGPDGAIAKYLRSAGVKPGMGLMDIYSAINAGHVGRYGASDAAAGGAPGTVADKVNAQMEGHRAKARALLGMSGGAGSNGLPGSAGADTLGPGPQAVPPGYKVASVVENGQLVQKIIPAGNVPQTPEPSPMPGLSSPMVPMQPQQAQPAVSPPQGPAMQPSVVPASGPPPQAMPQAPQAPMSAYQRMMMTSLGKDGGLEDPRNRAIAQQAGLRSQPMSMPNAFAPQAPMAPQGMPEAGAPQAPAMGGGNPLAQARQFILSPTFADLEPNTQAFVLQEYQRMQAAAQPPDPMDQVKLETAQIELDRLKNPQPKPGYTLLTPQQKKAMNIPDDVQVQVSPEGKLEPVTGLTPKETAKPAAIQEYEYAKEQGFPGTFQDWEASKKGGMSLQVDPSTGQVTFQQGGNIKPMTEAQSKDTVYATRAEGALKTFDPIADKLTSLGEKMGGSVPLVGNYLTSEDYQKAEQSGREFLAAVLRKDTGAAITSQEMEQYGAVYLPTPGNGPEVLAQKKASRARALEAMKAGMTPQAILAQEKALAASGTPEAAPAAPAQTGIPNQGGPSYKEGDILISPKTQKRIILRNNMWVPYDGQ